MSVTTVAGSFITVNTIDSDHYVDGSIDTAHLGNNQVDGAKLALASQAAGDIMYYNGTDWIRLVKGTADQVLTMNDGATAPNWEAASAGAALTGSTDNTVVTVTGADAMVGEANLGFTGTNLGIGVLDPDNFLEIKGGNNAYININHTGGAGGYQSGVLFKTSDTQNYKIDVTGNGDMTWRAGASETVAMILDSTGALTMPLQPAFCAHQQANVLNVTGNGSAYTQVFTTEIYDQNADFAASPGTTFTAPVTGKYVLTSSIRIYGQTTAMTYGVISLVTSNRTWNVYTSVEDTTVTAGWFIAAVADMDANDSCHVVLTVYGEASDLVDIAGSSSNSISFSGVLVA